MKILPTSFSRTGGGDLFKSLLCKGERSNVPSLGIQTQSNMATCLSAPEPVILRHVGRHWSVDTAAGRGAVASLHCGRAHAGTCDRRHHWRWQLSKHRDSLSIWRNAETQWRAAGGALAEWAELVGQWIQVTSAPPCYTPLRRDDRWANNSREPRYRE